MISNCRLLRRLWAWLYRAWLWPQIRVYKFKKAWCRRFGHVWQDGYKYRRAEGWYQFAFCHRCCKSKSDPIDWPQGAQGTETML